MEMFLFTSIYIYINIYISIHIYIYQYTYYNTLHCITFRYNTIQWQYIYSTFTVQYTTLHNVTLHTYIPAKVHQIARTEVMVRNFQGQKSGLMFIKVELSYTYLYNSKDKVLVYIYGLFIHTLLHIYIYIFNSKDRVLGYIYICNSKDKVLVYMYIYIYI